MPDTTGLQDSQIQECTGVVRCGKQYHILFEWGALWLDHPLVIGKRYLIHVNELAETDVGA